MTPVPQELPCPDQRLVYECHATEGLVLSWVLPNGATLRFGSLDGINSTESSGISTATLTGIIQSITVTDIILLSFNSTLWIEQPPTSWNNSELICRLAAIGSTVGDSTNITLSGK